MSETADMYLTDGDGNLWRAEQVGWVTLDEVFHPGRCPGIHDRWDAVHRLTLEPEPEQAGLFDVARRKLRPTVNIVDAEGRL